MRGGIRTDILIRDVPEPDIRKIDEKAGNAGISRTEYLRRLIAECARRSLSPSKRPAVISYKYDFDITTGGLMTDILIRDVPEPVLRRIDEKAKNAGISRTEYLRRQIAEDARRAFTATSLQPTDFAKFADLADDELMTAAWQ